MNTVLSGGAVAVRDETPRQVLGGGPYLNTFNAARYLDLSTRTLRNWRCLRKGPRCFERDGHWYYPQAALDAYVASEPEPVVEAEYAEDVRAAEEHR